jgi:hypothetical protein
MAIRQQDEARAVAVEALVSCQLHQPAKLRRIIPSAKHTLYLLTVDRKG